jgi:hypothetical protein
MAMPRDLPADLDGTGSSEAVVAGAWIIVLAVTRTDELAVGVDERPD